MEQAVSPNAFGIDEYITSKNNRIYKVRNVPGACWTMDTREPAYRILLVGEAEEYSIRIPKAAVEANYKKYVQPKELFTEVTPELYQIGDSVMHINTGGVYPVTHLPSDNVLENSRRPAYGYQLPDGRTCWRAQHEMEDGRFTKIDKSIAAMLLLTD